MTRKLGASPLVSTEALAKVDEGEGRGEGSTGLSEEHA